MDAPAKGAVVLVRFPFSDLSATKLRPAVVLADAGRGDRVLCQVTSKPYGDPSAVVLKETAFTSGSLRVVSYARAGQAVHGEQRSDDCTSRCAHNGGPDTDCGRRRVAPAGRECKHTEGLTCAQLWVPSRLLQRRSRPAPIQWTV